jgi:hypothetical protein
MVFRPGQRVHVLPSPPPAPASSAAGAAALSTGSPATIPSIEFLTPVEGQTIDAGDEFLIQWTQTSAGSSPEYMALRARPFDGADWLVLSDPVPTAQGTHLWDTSALQPGGYVIGALWQDQGLWQQALAANALDIRPA